MAVDMEEIERDIRIAIWNGARWQGSPQEVAQSLIRKIMDEPCMKRVLAALTKPAALPKEGEEEARLAGRRDAREVFDRHEPAMAEALSSLPVRSGEVEKLREAVCRMLSAYREIRGLYHLHDEQADHVLFALDAVDSDDEELRAALAPPPQAQDPDLGKIERGMRVAGHFFDARALRPAVEAMCPGKGIDYFETCDIARPLLSACRRRGLNATYVAGRLLQWARIEGFVRHRGRGQWVRCDSDGSPKGGDACGSVHDSAGRQASPDLGSPTTIVRGE